MIELEEYYCLEPFGEFREEIRHGQLSATIVNMHKDWKESPKPENPYNYMNFVEHRDEEEAPIEAPEVLSARIRTEVFNM